MALRNECVTFLDEIEVSCCICHKYGRSLVGTAPREITRVPRSKKYLVSAAITRSGIIPFQLIDKACKFEIYLFLIQGLLSKLAINGIYNSASIIGNRSIHKAQSIRYQLNNLGTI
ncbi:hypothetical protein H311_00792 [Anncaliia algerae PRA109]|nr:hypothetical protein H311_00792 [Anncaliia algerae PRA109]